MSTTTKDAQFAAGTVGVKAIWIGRFLSRLRKNPLLERIFAAAV
jgi:hypothetical protein